MDLNFDEPVIRGLRGYVGRVTSALRLSGDSWCVQAEHPRSIYVALDGRLPPFPDRDVALVWDEERGWSVAVETPNGKDLVVLAHLDGQVFPPPDAVADWVDGLFHERAVPAPREDASRRASRVADS